MAALATNRSVLKKEVIWVRPPPHPVLLTPLRHLLSNPFTLVLRLQVRNKHTNELLVLKVIQFDVSSDVTRKQVTTELRTLYGASHPHVVRYHQAFFDNGAITIVMEYMDGGSLADVLKLHKTGLPER
jgi:hypothetical protein